MSGRYPTWDSRAALLLARFAHHGQVDKAGWEYIEHPLRVANEVHLAASARSLDAGEAYQVAVLHDVLEDTQVTAGMLYDLGCPVEVTSAVMLLTRPRVRSEEGTARYYRHIAADPLALLVKEYDIRDNLDPVRLDLLPETLRERLRTKYIHALRTLGLDDVVKELGLDAE